MTVVTDGPVAYPALGKIWEKFMDALQNDAHSVEERRTLAVRAVVKDILTDENQALLAALRRYSSRTQLELVPTTSVEEIFSHYDRSALSDSLRREIIHGLNKGLAPAVAFEVAISSVVDSLIREMQTRLIDEIQLQPDKDGLYNADVVDRVKTVFKSMSVDDICEMLASGDTNAAKARVIKKTGIDEGPEL